MNTMCRQCVVSIVSMFGIPLSGCHVGGGRLGYPSAQKVHSQYVGVACERSQAFLLVYTVRRQI